MLVVEKVKWFGVAFTPLPLTPTRLQKKFQRLRPCVR